MSNKQPRTLRVAVDDPRLRDELTQLFRREQIDVTFVERVDGTELASVEADVVVVRPDDLDQRDDDLLRQGPV